MALAPYTASTLPSDSPAIAAWVAAHAAALPKGAKLREVLRGKDAAGVFIRVVAWRASGPPSLRVDGGDYGGDADFTGEPTPDAVRALLERAAKGAAWQDPNAVRAPSAPGERVHQDAVDRWRPDAAATVGRGNVLVVAESGTCATAGPGFYERWTAADAQPPTYRLAGGLSRDELEACTWAPVARALERWRKPPPSAPQPAAAAEPLKVGQVIPATTDPPVASVVRVKGGFENGAVFLIGEHGAPAAAHACSGGGALRSSGVAWLREHWRPQSFEVLALGVPEAWDARSARVLAGLQAETPRPWAEVPANHLARNAQGLVAWKRPDGEGVFVRGTVLGSSPHTYAASGKSPDSEGYCAAQGPWTILTGPHVTPADADEAICLLLGHGRLEPEPVPQPAPAGADEAATALPDPVKPLVFAAVDPGATTALAPEAAKALSDAVVAAQEPQGAAGGVRPGDRVPWAQVPPGSLVLDEDGDPIWRLSSSEWRRLGLGEGERWRALYGIDRDYTPACSRECLVVCTGVPESAELGDLVGLAIASGHAPDASAALRRLPAEVQERALQRAGDAGRPVVVADGRFAAADAALERAVALFGECASKDARALARAAREGRELQANVSLGSATVRAVVRGGALHVERTCGCATCSHLAKVAPMPLAACGPGGSEAAGAAEVLALLAGLPEVASERAPWAALHAVSASTLSDYRPDLGGSSSAGTAIDAVRWRAVADAGRLGERLLDVGALSAREVAPWRWEVRTRANALLSSRAWGAGLMWSGVALCAADAIAQAVRGTALDFGGDCDAVGAAAPLPYECESPLFGTITTDWYRAGIRMAPTVGSRVARLYAVDGDAQIALPLTRSRVALRVRRPCLVAVTHVVADRLPHRGAAGAALARLARRAWGPQAPMDARLARGAAGPGLFLLAAETPDGRLGMTLAVGPGAPRAVQWLSAL